ncbi:imidazole glycerol phosphate synthase subunit HisH [Pelagibius litoralis]|uniref:Imidazole glycerol phosphate synthase subunit HisH n=1 Tax=Pelagibius litoralis TaxID=374515 RepID=A0A967F2J3_9PROT|nr:imidazole glycerol phosphate synthase subunit HisH [Pelagibius litoralis]NIA71736.1 imidazole glycerol phosphate synthase subunit HisH [Pelagibius litoralis]
MSVAIIDYGSGNLRSAAKSLERAAAEVGGGPVRVTDDPAVVRAADRVVLPGVGAFGDCRAGLHALPGMVAALVDFVETRQRPFLGICVGMQLMASRGLEHGSHAGFGWIPGDVVALAPAPDPARDPGVALKVPHMGWNQLQIEAADHALLAGLPRPSYVYFVHSYHLRPADPRHLLASVDYGGLVTAVVGRDNLAGTQFHPEKSQAVGLRFLSNFLRWCP